MDPVLPDVDGVCVADLEPDGPALRRASIDCERFAAALDAEVSEDAGAYVCNAWLYQALGHLDLPTGFLHIPPAGMDAARLLRGLAALVAASRASATGG